MYKTTILLTALMACALATHTAAESDLEKARELSKAGVAAFERAVEAEDRAGQDDAATTLREALRLFNSHIDANPADLEQCEKELTELNSILFWHGRMSPPDFGDEADDEAARAERERRRQQERAELAQQRLKEARAFASANPVDLYGQRAELRELMIEFPGTEAAEEADRDIARLDEEIREKEAAEAARDAELADEEAPAPTDDDMAIASAPARVIPVIDELRAELDAMKGSDAERAVRETISELFARRRFIDARDRCRGALLEARDGGDRDRIDRVLAGLTRAVTIMDHVLAEAAVRAGDDTTVEVIGGAEFSGRLDRLGLGELVLISPKAELHVPFFRLSDDSLVEFAAAREEPEARLAAAAFLALLGEGKRASTHLRAADEAGADEEEVAAIGLLAGDEKTKAELAKRIKVENSRWRYVTRAVDKIVKKMQKQGYLDALKELLKCHKKAKLTDRDLTWLSDQMMDELGQPLGAVIKDARETCDVTHYNPDTRIVLCPRCDGTGSILTRNPSGLFGPKPKNPVRVTCPACKGDRYGHCPSCYDRFHDEDVRALEARSPK